VLKALPSSCHSDVDSIVCDVSSLGVLPDPGLLDVLKRLRPDCGARNARAEHADCSTLITGRRTRFAQLLSLHAGWGRALGTGAALGGRPRSIELAQMETTVRERSRRPGLDHHRGRPFGHHAAAAGGLLMASTTTQQPQVALHTPRLHRWLSPLGLDSRPPPRHLWPRRCRRRGPGLGVFGIRL
jgi:hypothetical protein